ncbi:MAG: hypothetical protein PVH88_00675 [Ignavibacteria bacterium]|jgi:hypothetical protein
MKKTFTFFVYLFLFLFTSVSLHSQTLEETLNNLSSSAGEAYVAPVSNAFGSNLNSGWYSGLPKPIRRGLTLRVKVVAIGSFFSDDDRTFTANGNFRFTEEQADEILTNSTSLQQGTSEYNSVKDEMLDHEWSVGFSGPTIVGSENEYLEVDFPGATIQGETIAQYNLTVDEVKGFLDDLSILPQAAVQLNVGTVMGTNVVLRWFPELDIKDLGKFKMFGFGFIHNINTWLLNPLPIDLGVGFYKQTLEVGDIFESSSTQFGVYASKTFGKLISFTPYLGLTTESADTEIKYDYTFDGPGGISETAKINFELEGENSFGTTIGFKLRLAYFDIIVDYKAAKTSTLSSGIALGF